MTKHYPGGTGTFSKGLSQFSSNAPRFVVSGSGSHVLGSDDKTYIDWTAALGAVSLGYADKDVLRATQLAAQNGNVFGLPHRLEWDYADALSEVLPWGDDSAVKYGKHGSDVTSAAIRVARYITGRPFVISDGYHGWHNEFAVNPNGVPAAVHGLTVPLNAESLQKYADIAAALIVEPESRNDLPELRAWCSKNGVLLVFDEVLSGFRTPQWTVGQHRGVTPDLLCLAKAIGSGWPLSVIAGPSQLMKPFAGDIGYSFTFGGECVTLAAGVAVLKKYRQEPVIDRLWSVGQSIQATWTKTCADLGLDLPMDGQPSRLVVKYPTLAARTLISQEFFKRGIMWTVGATAMYAHTAQDVLETQEAIGEVLSLYASVKDDPASLVVGDHVGMPYRQMVLAGTST